jgi:uncharacterized phage protein (TIGR01671 family)
MREILFKAKRIDNGEWIEGYYTECRGETFIGIDTSSMFEIFCPPVIRWFKVSSETLCQFTGLCDKNGKRIWENDVVWLVCDGKEHIYQIVWDNSELDFKATKGEENYGTNYEYLLCCDEIEVIGNIFDNKELLQEEH